MSREHPGPVQSGAGRSVAGAPPDVALFGTDLGQRLTFWRAQDPDPDTVQALDLLVERAAGGAEDARRELEDCFAGRLEFGTAGLRGELGPGPHRMNRVVVGQAAAGLATWLLDHGFAGGRVIIGRDARHKSDVFARDTAEILAGAGLRPLLITDPTPTPLVAFGIRHFDCVAGVVVTASHNPPQDNGYKVYRGDGSQIVPPTDVEIAERIDRVARHPLQDVPRGEVVETIGPELVQAYVRRAAELVSPDAPRDLDWVYTPLHGVGGSVVEAVLAATEFTRPYVVTSQQAPDPDFPTVAFPNPEEPGAIDRAVTAAADRGAELVIANDPDADRCAVAVPAEDGDGWRMLTGDELGALLGDDALRRGVSGTYACSIVSGSLLQALAGAHRQPFAWTLTGFKWIGRVPGLAFGYEEAIGYCCDPAAVADKDGISALVRVLELACRLRAEGRCLTDRLAEIEAEHGVFLTDPLSVRVQQLDQIPAAMRRLRAAAPGRLAGEPVRIVDLALGSASQGGPELPPTDGLLYLGQNLKVVVRPSGTEPKLKCYLEVRAPAGSDRAQAASRLDGLRAELSTLLGL